jgi:hypothetical protein
LFTEHGTTALQVGAANQLFVQRQSQGAPQASKFVPQTSTDWQKGP